MGSCRPMLSLETYAWILAEVGDLEDVIACASACRTLRTIVQEKTLAHLQKPEDSQHSWTSRMGRRWFHDLLVKSSQPLRVAFSSVGSPGITTFALYERSDSSTPPVLQESFDSRTKSIVNFINQTLLLSTQPLWLQLEGMSQDFHNTFLAQHISRIDQLSLTGGQKSLMVWLSNLCHHAPLLHKLAFKLLQLGDSDEQFTLPELPGLFGGQAPLLEGLWLAGGVHLGPHPIPAFKEIHTVSAHFEECEWSFPENIFFACPGLTYFECRTGDVECICLTDLPLDSLLYFEIREGSDRVTDYFLRHLDPGIQSIVLVDLLLPEVGLQSLEHIIQKDALQLRVFRHDLTVIHLPSGMERTFVYSDEEMLAVVAPDYIPAVCHRVTEVVLDYPKSPAAMHALIPILPAMTTLTLLILGEGDDDEDEDHETEGGMEHGEECCSSQQQSLHDESHNEEGRSEQRIVAPALRRIQLRSDKTSMVAAGKVVNFVKNRFCGFEIHSVEVVLMGVEVSSDDVAPLLEHFAAIRVEDPSDLSLHEPVMLGPWV